MIPHLLTMQDKKLVKELLHCNSYKNIAKIIFKAYPNYFRDASYRIIKKSVSNESFDLLKIRQEILGKNSVYSDIAIKTAHEMKMKKIKAQYFNQIFKANFIHSILSENLASLIGIAHLPTITLFSLEEYIKDLKKIK